MYAVIAVPFFDTPANNRAVKGTVACLSKLLEQVQPPHIVVPVDNGSTDKRGANFARANFEHFVDTVYPLSIAEGVNSGWHLFHDQLMAGEAVAMKHDSDIISTPDDFVDRILSVIESNPDVYLVGPRHNNVNYAEHAEVIRDCGSYYECNFIFGGVQARSPECFRRIGYARQPYGKWGYGDGWDSWKVKRLKKRIMVIKDLCFYELIGHSALSEPEKNHKKAKQAFLRMRSEVMAGTRDIYQEFTGCLQ